MAMKPVCYLFIFNIQMEMYLMSTQCLWEEERAPCVCVCVE